MKTLLVAVNAKYIHSNLAVFSLCSYARRCTGADISVCEYTINQDADVILEDIYKRKADIVAFSCYIWNIHYIEQIIKNLNKLPDTPVIWLGGPEASYRPDEIISKFDVKGVMIGEGEVVFSELIRLYEKKNGTPTDEELAEIKGIVTSCISTLPEKLIDMDELPFVYEEMPLSTFENRIPYYETIRGCPFSCAYCLSSIDKTVRLRSFEKVEKELDFFLRNKVRQVKFVDRTFNVNEEHAYKIWKYIKDNDNGITNFHFEIAADLMTERLLSLIDDMRPALIQLEVGVQSTNPYTIKAINRVLEFEKVQSVSKRILANGNIHLHLDLIAGLPGENYESFMKSFNDVYSLKPNELQLGFLKVLNGTNIAKFAKEGHIVYNETPPYEVLYTDDIGYFEIRKLKAVCEMLEIYYNSGQFINTVEYLESFFEDGFSFYESVSAYYESEGISFVQSSRIRKYEILLEFAVKKINGINLPALKECMLKDLYLRENLKKRPEFLPERNTILDDRLHKFFLREKDNPKYLFDYADSDLKQIMRMTHTEVFCNMHGEERVFLFDYSRKNPITQNGTAYDITEEL